MKGSGIKGERGEECILWRFGRGDHVILRRPEKEASVRL